MANKVKRNGFLSTQLEVRNKIAKAIEDGTLKPGENLPNMKSVSEQEKCTLGTIMNSYKILLAEGYIKKESNRYRVIGPKKIKTNVVELNSEEKRPISEVAKSTTIKKKYDTDVKYLKVKDELVGRINSGEYKPGQAMESADIIARNLNVSRNTVKNAIKLLAKDGYVVSNNMNTKSHKFIVCDRTKSTIENIPDTIPGTKVESVPTPRKVYPRMKLAKRNNMEFKIVSNVPGIQVSVSQTERDGFIIHVNEYKSH